jgi:hypothetical protein
MLFRLCKNQGLETHLIGICFVLGLSPVGYAILAGASRAILELPPVTLGCQPWYPGLNAAINFPSFHAAQARSGYAEPTKTLCHPSWYPSKEVKGREKARWLDVWVDTLEISEQLVLRSKKRPMRPSDLLVAPVRGPPFYCTSYEGEER